MTVTTTAITTARRRPGDISAGHQGEVATRGTLYALADIRQNSQILVGTIARADDAWT